MTDPRVQLEDQHCVRGAPHTYTVTITKANSDGTTSAVDLTSYGSAWAGSLRGEWDYATHVDWTINASQAAQGILVLTLSADQTATMPRHTTTDLTRSDFVYDLRVTGGVVSPQYPFQGRFSLWESYTRG